MRDPSAPDRLTTQRQPFERRNTLEEGVVGGHVKVNPGEIHKSAGAARAIGEDFTKPYETAISASHTAASQLTGWSVTARLDKVAGDWAPVLAGVRDRLNKTADNLEVTAQAYTANENANVEVWQKQKIGEAWEKPAQ
ncbi:hypothetical protein PUR71_39295 [Streptomyces sp. SP17BM10]|uniref:hypothetical protein n=1 Tax=Streptomyces sp. SP17BM10 TaxID=3002530 RepID=UPI002E764197|nr:hypothetical protein [Streptomyces sp. SP17BM10]MEE1788904.1 hypothetical protein [Streptomyces sp. SP17BM10]